VSRRARKAGFTLLEVVLAVALVLSLMGALYAFYLYALDVRKAIAAESEMLAGERDVMDGLTNELRSAMIYPFLNLGLEGSAGRLVFISAGLPGPAAWVIRQSTEDPIPPEQDLQLVGYQLSVDPNTEEVLGLVRTCQKVISAESPGSARQTRLLSSRLRFVNFRFHNGSGWQAEWRMEAPAEGEGEQTSLLPVAVEITLGTEPLPEDMDVDEYIETHPTFRRVVFVPAGARQQRGTVVRTGEGASR